MRFEDLAVEYGDISESTQLFEETSKPLEAYS